MNLILLFPEDFVGKTRVQISDYRATHIREILRAEVGRMLKVGLVNEGIGMGTIRQVEKDFVELEVEIQPGKVPIPDISLVIALPRPQTLKKVLEIAGAIGVRRLMLINTARVQKSFFSSKLLKDQAWLKHIRLGLEQGGRTYLPELSLHHSLMKFMGEMKKLIPADATRLISHVDVDNTLWETPLAKPHQRHEIVCAIGPEGGWLQEEVEQFAENGFQPIRLGSAILRVENAICALLSQIELLQSRFLT
jgi:RsmE family RNA methyltransferase